MALSAYPAQARCLPRRRHGPRQDHPGAIVAAGAERGIQAYAQAELGGGTGIPACQLGRGNRAILAEC